MEFYISTSIHTVRLGHNGSGTESIIQEQQPLLFFSGRGSACTQKAIYVSYKCISNYVYQALRNRDKQLADK